MLNRFRKRTTRSAPSLLQQFRIIYNRTGERIRRRAPRLQDNGEERIGDETGSQNNPITPPSLASNTERPASSLEDLLPQPSYSQRLLGTATQSHEWNIPIPPDVMYHIIDTYLTPSMKLALCAALPVLRPYCYPQTFEHMTVRIDGRKPFLKNSFFVRIELYISVLDKLNPLVISTLDDFGYAVGEREHGVMSLAAGLAHDITSIELYLRETRWCQLDKYTKGFISALLRSSRLCSVSLKDFDIPVNLLARVQNLKILDVYRSPGRPENVFFPRGRGKVCVEKITLRHTRPEHCLVGPGSPFDWSRLRVIEYHSHTNLSLNIHKLLKLCSASLQRLDITIHSGDKGFECFEGPVDLSALTNLRHVTLSICLASWSRDTLNDNDSGGTYSSLTPFKWVPIILASCKGHSNIEKIVLRFGAIEPEDPRHCDWLSVDKIFKREGTWTSLKEVLVVIMEFWDEQLYTSDALEPEHLEWVEPSTMPCLQARGVISWRKYNRFSE